MRYQLITPYWEAPEPRRNEELRYCERLNRERFDTVLMPKGRPTYRDLFTLCAEDSINVVANSDIYFDDSIRDIAVDAFVEMRQLQTGVAIVQRWLESNSNMDSSADAL